MNVASSLRIATLFCLLALPINGEAQTVPTGVSPLGEVAPNSPLTPPPGPLLDAAVGRTDYRLGPGDLVALSVIGSVNLQYSLRVAPEGAIVIPAVGMVSVIGRSVEEAEDRVRQALARLYRGVEVELALLDVRRFKVYLAGDIPSPGVREATAVTRVGEVVRAALQDSLADSTAFNRRTVEIRRAGGEVIEVDLARFNQLGDLSANPTLLEGDVVLIPAIDETVRVLGRVSFPGTYQYRRGETLADLLRLASGGGGFMGGATDSIRISRSIDGLNRTVTVLTQAQALGPQGDAIQLNPFDAVYVSESLDYRDRPTAVVRGQVMRPGTYPVEPGRTTVRELVEFAGGFAPNASLTSASLRRTPVGSVEQRLRQLRSVPTELLTSEERRILYAASQGGEQGVVVDFVRLFASGEDAYNQVLQDGDTLIIPERREEISVLGAVRQPGIVQFAPGRTVANYVALAGGYQRGADRGEIVVVKARSTARVGAGESELLDSEDAIVVPFREDRQWLALLQTTSMVVTTVTSLVFTFVALFGER